MLRLAAEANGCTEYCTVGSSNLKEGILCDEIPFQRDSDWTLRQKGKLTTPIKVFHVDCEPYLLPLFVVLSPTTESKNRSLTNQHASVFICRLWNISTVSRWLRLLLFQVNVKVYILYISSFCTRSFSFSTAIQTIHIYSYSASIIVATSLQQKYKYPHHVYRQCRSSAFNSQFLARSRRRTFSTDCGLLGRGLPDGERCDVSWMSSCGSHLFSHWHREIRYIHRRRWFHVDSGNPSIWQQHHRPKSQRPRSQRFPDLWKELLLGFSTRIQPSGERKISWIWRLCLVLHQNSPRGEVWRGPTGACGGHMRGRSRLWMCERLGEARSRCDAV